ncbi:hypothetical protein CBS147339_4188 [Penicillium roqueforti]|nr:hypothetical protein DTO012A8_7394 [Penicillium roqueforti]KAI3078023.1 hypothetical protein CBS147339_4188 [Penicillium roqueforti]KAI3104963.1 hypothetical protein CBS147338_1411 [Penicillium roqueforti]KAI3134442.1 hypothetical protein CBS147325_8168 [Penicillium roqueforti]KAI3181181.1 hypothetical protein DTO032C6_7733 [Penicillium roqueforti]
MVAAIAAAASAAPQPVVPTMTLVARNSVNDCGPSTFINRSSGGSPRFGVQHQLVQYGTCAFGVTSESSGASVHIGNQDIIDLINSSIARFEWNGLVGAAGYMSCQREASPDFLSVRWGLYHT